jgi:hypothetical protein
MFRIQSRNNERGYTTFDGWKQWGGVKNMYGTEMNGNMSTASSVASDNYNDNNNNIKNFRLENYAEKNVTVNGKRYTYRETESGSAIYLYHRDSTKNCFEIFFDTDNKGNKYAHLDSFYNFSDCCNTIDSTGRDLFLAVVKLLTEKGGLKYMLFSDNSGKKLENGEWISLADTYFVSTGKTWYESILPLTPDEPKRYKNALRNVKKATWEYAYAVLKDNNPDIEIPVDISDINGKSPGSAMQVFRRIKEAKTTFFADNNYSIMASVGYASMSGMKWKYYFPDIQ